MGWGKHRLLPSMVSQKTASSLLIPTAPGAQWVLAGLQPQYQLAGQAVREDVTAPTANTKG